MALAQETQYLLLDEPTTFLDLVHQMELMEMVQRLNEEHQKTVVLVLHDLNLAARYADHIIVFHQGYIVAQGTPPEVLTPHLLSDVFQIKAHIFQEEQSGSLLCVPLGVATKIGPMKIHNNFDLYVTNIPCFAIFI
jgi:iron complex transport system ATP-binding protein